MFKKIVIIMTLAVFTLADGSILQTGQTKSYNADGTIVAGISIKDDGYYRAGADRNYSRSGDVVIDNATGLEWQDDENIQKPWVTQENWSDSNYSDTSGDTATTYCSELTLNGGSWRLPSIKELDTLVDNGRIDPSVTEGIFNYTASSDYWSSTSSTRDNALAWVTDYGNGRSRHYVKNANHYVRCVKGELI
ncbi:MAG: DUF1566 domain-containing protein, partial [Deltaproteobacteria bacterium]|nr:DUF1566 domain-containing protein [Deltaproteobacteria bacterium]